MKVAFRYANASFFGRLISFWTRSKYQHVEIIFEHPQYIAFSSSEDDGGTRFKPIDQLDNLNDTKKWNILPISVSESKEVDVYEWVNNNLLHLKYNWADILSFVFRNINPDDLPNGKNSWICSAVSCRIIQECGYFIDIRCGDCSPELLFELVESQNYLEKTINASH
jgi:hypothetical protein